MLAIIYACKCIQHICTLQKNLETHASYASFLYTKSMVYPSKFKESTAIGRIQNCEPKTELGDAYLFPNIHMFN